MFITIYALINNNHQLKTNLPSNGAIYKKNDFSNLNKKSGFWTFIDTPSENIIVSNHSEDINHLTSLVIEVVKNNSEFQKQMFDMCKNMQSTIMTKHVVIDKKMLN